MPTARLMQGGTSVPVSGPNGSRLIETPCSSYMPHSRSTYFQSAIDRSSGTFFA